MALVVTQLASSLQQIFEQEPFPDTAQLAGTKWADAYFNYASAAQAGPTLPTTLAAGKATLGTSLGGAFDAAKNAGQAGLPIVTAQMAAAFAAFWIAPPVVFAGPGFAGVVSVAVPASLIGALTSAFNAGVGPSATAEQQAQSIAGALDTWTKTVMVVNTPLSPPGPPNPPVPLA